ncbi:MAG: DUF1622 domain-containing protein [Brevefilum sp.]|nr:DUF1622 domain-containing protein [Brevefilum sp.]MDW7753677.1 DUF1622 domain-containing protein [Brevefilum sp.]
MTEKQPQTTRSGEHWFSYILPVSIIAGLVALLIVMSGHPTEELQPIIPQEEWLNVTAGYLIIAAEAAAAFVIGAAVLRAVVSYVQHLLDPMTRQIDYTERIRLRLGHMLNLGLEFAMGSDILRLAVSPSTGDVIILFAIVLLRILLNYFLEREIRSSEEFCGPGDYVPPLE